METAVLKYRNACCENSHHENKMKNTYSSDGGPLKSYSLFFSSLYDESINMLRRSFLWFVLHTIILICYYNYYK